MFAAGETLGRADAFLARELTDGVVHFLASELDGATPTTSQVADLVIKVVRELGQPALAQAFAEGARRHETKADQRQKREAVRAELAVPCSPGAAPSAVVRECLRRYSLHAVFARDLVAAQADGLLTLTGLHAPLELAGCVLGPPEPGQGLLEAIGAARLLVGGVLAIDGPEYLVPPEDTARFVRELCAGMRATGLRAVVNLNAESPPSWADAPAVGPLFAQQPRCSEGGQAAALALELLERLVAANPAPGLRLDWHLGERDVRPGAAGHLPEVCRRAAEGAPVAFVFDRPRSPIALAEGLDRRHPATLLTVVLPLHRLAELVVRQGGGPAVFLRKLGSLARLALSAAVQKRDYLRRHNPALAGGFILDRARLVVAPQGLEGTAAAFAGAPSDLARQVIARLQEVLQQDGRATHLEACLDGSLVSATGYRAEDEEGEWADGPKADGKGQLRATAPLYTPAELGSATVKVTEDRLPAADQVTDWLRWAWKQTAIRRLRLVRVAARHEQLTFSA